jgi:outer membrane protein OmpA-like peptidoglycan-associated protein
MPGSPDDGLVLFRPVTREQSILFAQIGLGYSLNPLHLTTITSDRYALANTHGQPIQNQLTQYTTFGVELADRIILSATLPITWWQSGTNPQFSTGITGGPLTTVFDASGPSVSDARIDFRYVAWRSLDRKAAVGLQLSMYAPSGNGSRSNFGGDGGFAALPMITGEYTLKFITFVANTGVAFRPYNAVNDPTHGSGVGIGDEWRWAVGAFIPLMNGRHRIGGTIFGQTGIENNDRIGDTFFGGPNTPVEWNAEWRMKLAIAGVDQFWVGAGGGTRIAKGYGAPDLRVLALFGAYVPILESDAVSPDPRKVAKSDRDQMRDTDHDGIPDDLDPCPLDPEDHQEPDPNDGCPKLPDRDGDGIPDKFDKCPDEPGPGPDGCPRKNVDTDSDGIPDATDACPREPGQPDPDPKKNGCPKFIKLEGSQVRILQQVHFQTASAVILADSFPMLQEIVNLLKANPSIKKMMIEGHTDSDGPAPYNLKLSDQRAASVRAWLVQHGVEANRLDSHGYGEEKPIDDNNTAKGRAANRRVEFKITEETK